MNLSDKIEALIDASKYDEAARLFFEETGATIKKTFLDNDLYFPEDKEARDIYQIIIIHKGQKMKFTFGQSIADKGKLPSNYSVLSCLELFTPEDFQEFCAEYGFEEDSRNAMKTWKACLKLKHDAERLFDKEEIEALATIR